MQARLGIAMTLRHDSETQWVLKLGNSSIFHAKGHAKVLGSKHRKAGLGGSMWCHFPAPREDQLYLDHPQQVFSQSMKNL